jgi:protein SCO1
MMRAVILGCAIAAMGCGDHRAPVPPQGVAPHDPAGPAAVAVAPSPSSYDLDAALTDHHGRPIGLDVHRGHTTLIAMFYGSCAAACPRLLHDVTTIVDALPPARRAELRVLLISFDAARDTPERLATMAREYHLADATYTLAAAAEPDARAVSAVLGIKYRKLDSGEFFHTSSIIALDPTGVPFARVDGFVELDPMIARLEQSP